MWISKHGSRMSGKITRVILSCLLSASLSVLPAFGWGKEPQTTISGEQLSNLITISVRLKADLITSKSNCQSLQSSLELSEYQLQQTYGDLTNLQQTSTGLSLMLSNSTESFNQYKKEANDRIGALEGQRNLWIGTGIGGIILGTIIVIFAHK